MKKVVLTLSFLAILFTLLVIPAQAASGGTAELVVTPNAVTANPGQQLTFTISLKNPSVAVNSVGFTVTLPAGFDSPVLTSISDGSFNDEVLIAGLKFTANRGKNITGNLDLATLTCTVTNKAQLTGNKIDLTSIEIVDTAVEGGGNKLDVTPKGATITVEHREKVDTDHDWVSQGHKDATCTEDGGTTSNCSVCGQTKFEKDENKLGHVWGDVQWEWQNDGANTKPTSATRTCKRDTCQTTETATNLTVKPDRKYNVGSCLKDETQDFIGSGKFGEESVTSPVHNVTLKTAPGHDWQGEPVWNWDDIKWDPENPDTVPTGVIVTRTCANGDIASEHQVTVTVTKEGAEQAATCEADGYVTYKASATFNKNATGDTQDTKEDSHQLTLPQKQHNYEGDAKFEWNTDSVPVTATATLHCAGVGRAAHDVPSEGEVRVEPGETTATCTKAAETPYTAYAKFPGNSKEYTATTTVTGKPLGHHYVVEEFKWPEPDGSTYEMGTFQVTRTCDRDGCDGDQKTQTVTITFDAGGNKGTGTDPTCNKTGTHIYTATATFPAATDGSGTTGETVTKTHEVTFDELGHEWEDSGSKTFDWVTSDPEKPSASYQVKCKHINCDGDGTDGSTYYGEGKGMVKAADVTRTNPDEKPTCEQAVTAHWTAKVVSDDGAETYTDTKDTTLDALGHDWTDIVDGEQVESAIQWSWTETPGDYTATATRTCNNGDQCDFEADGVKGKQKVDAVVTPETKEPTYLEEGTTTYTATAKFKDKTNDLDATVVKTKTWTETIDKLDPPEVSATADSGVADKDTAEEALADSVEKAVSDALNSTACPAGMDEELYNAIRKAGEGTEAEPMSVTTKLIVRDAGDSPAEQSPVYTPTTGIVQKYYDINIEVTVTGKGVTSTVSYIHQTADEILFSVPKAGDGPIWYVARYHNGWQKLPTTLVNNQNLQFSSNLFSDYAVISSSDIADAEVEPIPDQTYTGSAITPKVVVYINGDRDNPLEEGVDYELEWHDNVNVGDKAYVIIKALDDNDRGLTGTKTVYFRIVAAPSTGGGSGKPTAPNTGDETNIGLYAGLTVLGLTALAAVTVLPRKRKNK